MLSTWECATEQRSSHFKYSIPVRCTIRRMRYWKSLLEDLTVRLQVVVYSHLARKAMDQSRFRLNDYKRHKTITNFRHSRRNLRVMQIGWKPRVHCQRRLIPFVMSEQGQEKWSSVRITDSKKNPIKVENHVSIHSNLNLNGLCPSDQKGIGNEVKSCCGWRCGDKSPWVLIVLSSLAKQKDKLRGNLLIHELFDSSNE